MKLQFIIKKRLHCRLSIIFPTFSPFNCRHNPILFFLFVCLKNKMKIINWIWKKQWINFMCYFVVNLWLGILKVKKSRINTKLLSEGFFFYFLEHARTFFVCGRVEKTTQKNKILNFLWLLWSRFLFVIYFRFRDSSDTREK